MTISNTAVSVTAIGNGSQTIFNYGFLLPAGASYLLQQIDTSGNVTTIATTAYSVSGVGNATGGTFTYSPGGGAVPLGYQLIFTRVVPYEQLTSLANQSAYYPAAVEAALDWLEMQIQQLAAAPSSTAAAAGFGLYATGTQLNVQYGLGVDTALEGSMLGTANGPALLDASAYLSANSTIAATTLSGATSIPRTLAARAGDGYNFCDYGVQLLNNVNNSGLVTALLNALPNNSIVDVPIGNWDNTITQPTGKRFLFNLRGTLDTNGASPGTNPVMYLGDGNVTEGFVSGSKYFSKKVIADRQGAPTIHSYYTNNATSQFSSGATLANGLFSGFTNGTTDNSGSLWNIQSTLNSGSTAVSLQEVGVASSVFKTGSAMTFCLFGQTNNVSGLNYLNSGVGFEGGGVGFELDHFCNGVEPPSTAYKPGTGTREGIHLVLGSEFGFLNAWTPLTGGFSAGGSIIPTAATNTSGYVYVCQSLTSGVSGTTGNTEPTWPTTIGSTVTDGNIVWLCNVSISAQISRGYEVSINPGCGVGAAFNVVTSGSPSGYIYDAVIEMSSATLQSYAGSLPAGIRMAANMPIDFSGAGTLASQNLRTLQYNSTSGNFEYQKSGNAVFAITDAGIVQNSIGVVAATGATQGTATALTAKRTVVSSGTGGVILSGTAIGIAMKVRNQTGSAVNVYPPSGGQINALGSNAPLSLAANAAAEFALEATSQWYSF